MKALIAKLLGIAGVIANYLFSKQGKLILSWAEKAIVWVQQAEEDARLLHGTHKFAFVFSLLDEAMTAEGLKESEGTLRKIIETAHGAWEAKYEPKS